MPGCAPAGEWRQFIIRCIVVDDAARGRAADVTLYVTEARLFPLAAAITGAAMHSDGVDLTVSGCARRRSRHWQRRNRPTR